MKVIVISQPKSGTYLCGEILKNLDIGPTHLHIAKDSYTYYDPKKLNQIIKDPKLTRVMCDLKDSVNKINENQYALSHLSYNKDNETLLRSFKKIILVRDEEERKESFDRWMKNTGREQDEGRTFDQQKEIGLNILPWSKVDNTLTLQFNDLLNDSQTIDKIQLFLFNKIVHNSNNVHQKSLNADTITKSSKRTN